KLGRLRLRQSDADAVPLLWLRDRRGLLPDAVFPRSVLNQLPSRRSLWMRRGQHVREVCAGTARSRAFPDLRSERPPVGGCHRTRTLSKQRGVTHMGSGSGLVVLRVTAWTLAVLLGGLQVMGHPYRLSSDDAISYLDVADAYLRHDWRSVVN